MIQSCVIKNKNLFEDVAQTHQNMRASDDVSYSILNYDRILNEMFDFITGYVNYKKNGANTYAGKVLSTTCHFYNTMFVDKHKYRCIITLADMKRINKSFLQNSKKLQDLLDELCDDENNSNDKELESLIIMTNRQYNKLSKVYRDDMKIYLWLSTSNSKVFSRDIDTDLKIIFNDPDTPVMHKNV